MGNTLSEEQVEDAEAENENERGPYRSTLKGVAEK